MDHLGPVLTEKLQRLRHNVGEMQSVLVAFSGGVDSSLLLKVCHDVLGEKCAAATASSPIHPGTETTLARQIAQAMGVRHLVLDTDELADEQFTANPPERCYLCRKMLLSRLIAVAGEQGYALVVDGANADDQDDFRPGARAARELGVRSPLQQVGLTKNDIRMLAKEMGLPNWDKPSLACLATRFPYGERLTADKLAQIAQAEERLGCLGLRQFRVRHHGDSARIEAMPEDMPKIMAQREAVAADLRELGFAYVTLDLLGYRTGSMNETLSEETKKAIARCEGVYDGQRDHTAF